MEGLITVQIDPEEAELAATVLNGAADTYRDIRLSGRLGGGLGMRPSFNELAARNVARQLLCQVALQAQGGGGERG